MSIFIPDAIYKSIVKITMSDLERMGIKGVILDLDGTLGSVYEQVPKSDVIQFVDQLKREGIKVLVLSNNSHRERVELFCRDLFVPFIHFARKPFKMGYNKAVSHMKLKASEIAAVGDQIYTDVLGAHRSGMKAIYVYPIDLHLWYMKLRGIFEWPIVCLAERRLRKNTKGLAPK